jgi:serine/threonine-protein kinase
MHRRFFDEAQITGQLQHPGIVSVYEMGSSREGRPYFAMRLIQGKTLAELMRQFGNSSLEHPRLLNIYAKVCQAIAYAHSRGIIHMDLKPANVMVGAYGEVHVMDWGLSRRLEDLASECHVPAKPSSKVHSNGSNKITGTPAYMPPEQARGRKLGLHSDVFGLGGVLCEILTGQPPFIGKNVRQVYRRSANGALRGSFERLDACNADLALIALAKRCLARNPSERPSDAGVIASEITSYLESSMERAERDLCHFFDISTDLFCLATLDGYFKRVNSNFMRVLGYSDNELVSRPFIDFIHPNDVEGTNQAVQQLSNGEPVAEFRNRYRDAEGNFRWLEWTAKSIPGDNIIFAVAKDITSSMSSA